MQSLRIPGVRFVLGWVMEQLFTFLSRPVRPPLQANLHLFRWTLTLLFTAPPLHLHKRATNEPMNSMR